MNNMKRFLHNIGIVATLVVALFALSSSSCKKKPEPTPSSSVTLSISNMTLSATGETSSLTITSSDNWSASGSGVTVTPSSGKSGSTKVEITVPANTTGKERTFTVTFKAGSKTATLTIKQPASGGGGTGTITVNPKEIIIGPEANATGSVDITCSGSWQVKTDNKPDWVTKIEPTSGNGNGKITITTAENTERTSKVWIMSLSSGTNTNSVAISKSAATNHAPSKPTNLAPKGSGAETMPEFSWTGSTDSDGDEVKYTVQVSEDNTTWKSYSAGTATKKLSPDELKSNTTYYYKVVATDGYEGGQTESDVVTFTTGTTKSYYADCEYKIYQEASVSGATPIILIYTGDGYTQDLYKYGGQFDQEIDKGIEALFAIEPYKTYRDYFTVYKIAAYSEEAGMSVKSPEKTVNTRFQCTWEGGNSTGISVNRDRVFEVVSNIPGRSTLDLLTWSPISVQINSNEYAGTCTMWAGFGGFGVFTISCTPSRHRAGSGYGGFENTLRHEFGGHGFGLLADEYVYYNETIPANAKQNRVAWKSYSRIGAYGNITFESDINLCEWAQFVGLPEYVEASISLYPGAVMYSSGVYRSEQISCMVDNRPHFNTQSRWQIYRRIMISAGLTPTLEDFMSRDVEKVQPTSPLTKSPVKMERIPHEPIMYYNGKLMK